MLINHFLILFAFVYSLYTDIRYQKIKNYITIPILIILFLVTPIFSFTIGFLISYIISIFCFKFEIFGGGDIKFLWLMGGYLGLDVIAFILFSLLSFYIYSKITKKDKSIMMPHFCIGYLIGLLL
ncbi:MAG: prepilin peptidase [Atribacterota bacterium]